MVVNSHTAGSRNQQWFYDKKRNAVVKYDQPDKVFDVIDESKDPGAGVCVYDYHGGNNQKWKIEAV